ncbi:MAG: hypothetical protein MR487_12745 [Lachnospiraceae bacterium]|nr:hypothetical protein [Lachnospiraceae bacterium]
MKWCGECGAQLEDHQVYCSECGARQVGAEKENNPENTVNRPPVRRKKGNMIPALTILIIGMSVIIGMIFLQKQNAVSFGNQDSQGSKEEMAAVEGTGTPEESSKADAENETPKNTEGESKTDEESNKEPESMTNTEKATENAESLKRKEEAKKENEKKLSKYDFILKYSTEYFCLDPDVNALITVTPVSENSLKIDIVFPDSYEFEYYGTVIDRTSVDFTLDAGETIHMIWSDEYNFEVYPEDGFEDESIQLVRILCTALNYQKYNINAG